MSDVDSLQRTEEAVAQLRQEAAAARHREVVEDLRRPPLADTANKPRRRVTASLAQVRTATNMREGPLPEVYELAVSLIETGLLHPPLVRETGDAAEPYEVVSGHRRVAAMRLVDEALGEPREWELDVREGMSRREALTLQFAENFHQRKPEPIMFARAVRQIMIEDPTLTAAEVSRITGAPAKWTLSALKLLELPAVAERVEAGDLAFTAADMVRRAVSTGRVDEAEAVELAQKAADGEITTGELRRAVGYVPPKPENYDQLSSELDRARWEARRAAEHGGGRDADADQREWESGGSSASSSEGPSFSANVASGAAAGLAGPGGAEGIGSASGDPADEIDPEIRAVALDAYLLGRLLRDVAPAHREALGITDREGETFQYAFTLRPYERTAALRTLAGALLAEDDNPPRELRHLLQPA
ncbi:ParB/RepB/Spo0J family partition protein [Conexibacter arvalis]|uniref:ParB-like chromosome segregation protein Spo0J n=1 Tax=Conexibacter arvalis TaxID=912552 RepID=A0A840IG98_9ACTN|nr:ParB/RepB/Spo0J family partition protein [Conexibacter arvalis]MBB4664057.1 ParB-like chromosome segregation protein Spo0J [Conexibacter arvalis]